MDGATARCPVCSTPISQTRYAQIQTQIRQEEQAKASVLTQRLRKEHEVAMAEAMRAAEQRGRKEVEKKLAQVTARESAQLKRIADLEGAATSQREKHDLALKNAIKIAEARGKKSAEDQLAAAQLTHTKQAERIAELEAAAAMQRANASRMQEQLRAQSAADLKSAVEKATKDARATVMAELNAKDAELRVLKDSQAEELKQQRQILDEYRDAEIQKLRTEHARVNSALQKTADDLKRQLEQKTANELGDGAEIDLYQALHEAFDGHGDNIYRVRKGEPGADIIHEVMHNGQHCQTIVYDSKNHRQYRCSFVEKLLVDKANGGAEHAVLVTSVFPSGERDLCIVDGVVLAKPLQAVTIAALLRDRIVNDHLRNLSFKDRGEKKEQLYKLMSSEMFRQRMAAVEHAIEELEQIDVDEQKEHRKVWAARTVRYRTAHKSVTDLKIEVNVILQGDGPTDDVVAVAVGVSATGTDDAIPFDDGDDDIPF